ncbi:MAG: RnfH family protein [Gammaproteobacteria bacterium]
MVNGKDIRIEVAYALPEKQTIVDVRVPQGTTIEEGIRLSGILDTYPEIDLATQQVGLFGKLKKPAQALREGDRIEIYRPLIADPKEVRKQRAAQGKVMKKGGGEAAADKVASER